MQRTFCPYSYDRQVAQKTEAGYQSADNPASIEAYPLKPPEFDTEDIFPGSDPAVWQGRDANR